MKDPVVSLKCCLDHVEYELQITKNSITKFQLEIEKYQQRIEGFLKQKEIYENAIKILEKHI